MLRNLPMGLDQAGVHMVLKGAGYHGAYNYLYVPARFHDGTCLGYACDCSNPTEPPKISNGFDQKWGQK
eukprot:6474551-Amphidinium_carterae.1